MVFLIFLIIVAPFLSNEPILFGFFSQRYLLIALLTGLTILRSHFDGEKNINIKPLIISLGIISLYILITLNRKWIWYSLFSTGDSNPEEYLNFAKVLIIYLFLFIGLGNFGFYIFHKLKYKKHGNRLYRFIELITGISIMLYPILKGKAWYGVAAMFGRI